MTLQPTDILRYWLRAIRYEEALSTRPKAWRQSASLPGAFAINLREPSEGRSYFKLGLDDVETLIASENAVIVKPMDNEISEFFESWLSRQYRLQGHADEGPDIMVTCPTAHLRYDELAGIVRFTVSAEFTDDQGAVFTPPSRKQRREKRLPTPPTMVRLRRIAPDEGFPFFVDSRLMRRELGASREEVAALFSHLSIDPKLTAPAFLGRFTAFLDGGSSNGPISELLLRLTREMSRRLEQSPHGDRCFPIAVVMDAGRVKTTWHLQHEMQGLIDGRLAASAAPALYAYLTRTPVAARDRSMMGLLDAPGLTPSQQAGAERFLGSALTVVQGPPGTGKTTLVKHLAAHLLVARIADYVASGEMPTAISVITSTNNRAVDTVVDGLFPFDGALLPLAVRVGSRRICGTVFAAQLWSLEERLLGAGLDSAPPEQRELALAEAAAAFKKTLAEYGNIEAPKARYRDALAEQARLEKEIDTLLASGVAATDAQLGTSELRRIRRLVQRLEQRLDKLGERCERRPSKRLITQIDRYFEGHVAAMVRTIEARLARTDVAPPLFERPSIAEAAPARAAAAWGDATASALDAVSDTLDRLSRLEDTIERKERIARLQRTLRSVVIPPAPPPEEVGLDELRATLFKQALQVRDAYVVRHLDAFLDAIRVARRAAEEHGALRRCFRKRATCLERLSVLFPLWGCTLLSLGNVFDEKPGTLDRIIIDEAGQCHPAFAVSALMRARSALIIGDVHQLTPVFGLSAQDETPIHHDIFESDAADTEHYRVFDRSSASVQGLAQAGAAATIRLIDHFRCQNEIIDISNRLCAYDLQIKTPRRSRRGELPLLDQPLLRVPIDGVQERLGGSWWNAAEASAVLDWLHRLLGAAISADEIAVITPYRGQLFQLRRAITRMGIPIEASSELLDDRDPDARLAETGLAIGTVHRFQGGERSIVLFTTVVTQPRSLPFLNERVNLINVAVSRARDHLIVIGHAPTLAQGRMSRLLLENQRHRLPVSSSDPASERGCRR